MAERFDTEHRQIRIDDDRLLPALHEAVGAMSEPMVSHDCVAFYVELVRDALHAPVPRERALFNPAWVDRLLAEPNEHLTTLQGNTLWQLGLLELWLQAQGV